MREYLAKRLLLFLLTLLVASLIIFAVTRILPGDQVAEDLSATSASRRRRRGPRVAGSTRPMDG